jgi:hypothetical protein
MREPDFGWNFTRDDGNAVVRYVEWEELGVNRAEMLRYAGIPLAAAKKGGAEELSEHADWAIEQIKGQLVYKVGYLAGNLAWDEEGFPILPFPQKSEYLKKNLRGCDRFVMFAATVGAGMDRLIRRYEVADAAKGVLLQGLGAERVETLADAFNHTVSEEAEKNGYKTHPRFSPGFGDLPVTVQKDFLGVLDAGRRMGITLSESCLMAPSKSVTAIIGLEPKE